MMLPLIRAVLWRFCSLPAFAFVATGLAWQSSGAVMPLPHPQDGTVAAGIYTNKYFDLSYPLPAGWTTGMAGPRPSYTAYYVLSTLVPPGERTGRILIAAQDAFFAIKTVSHSAAMALDLARAMSEIDGTTVDQPAEVGVAGRAFSRVRFSGFGLFRSIWITEMRCHLVSFNLTTNNADQLAALELSLNKLGPAGDRGRDDGDPVCQKNQADPENLVKKVDPPASAPLFTRIPVRVIIDVDGSVKDVHVIRATVEQRSGIETALGQWKFRPPEIDGRAAAIETGLLIEFTPGGKVNYLPGDRAQF
jgi:hypothetical protein